MKATHEGTPQWSANLVGDTHGAEISTNSWDWEGEDGIRGFDVHVNREPAEPCDLEYEVTCTWGDETITATAVLHYLVPESLPGALDIDREYHGLKVGETFALPLRTVDGYSFGQHVQVSFDRDYNCDNWWGWENGLPTQYIRPHEPGILGANVRLRFENMSVEKYVIFFIADEDGNEPALNLSFEDENCYAYETDRAIFQDNGETGLYHDGWVRNYIIANFQAMKATHEGTPQWSANLVGDTHGAEISSNIWDWEGEDGARAFDVHVNREPAEPCDLEYEVTCTWGDETITATAVLHYLVPESLPGALDIAGEYHGLKVGETFSFPVKTYNDYSFGQRIDVCFDRDYNCENWWGWENGQLMQYVTPHEPGILGANVRLRFENMSVNKYVLFFINDENGNPPALELAFRDEKLYNFTVTRAAFRDDEENGVYHDGWVSNHELANYEAMKRTHEGEPQWSAELVGETYGAYIDTWNWDGEDGIRNLDVSIGNEPDFPCTLHYTVTCVWGDETITANCTLNYIIPDSMPGALDIPDEVHGLKVNETYSLYLRTVNGFTFGENVNVSFDTNGFNCDRWWDWDNGQPVQYIRPYEAGVYGANVRLRLENMSIQKYVYFYVEDENGEVPAPGLAFEDESCYEYETDRAIFQDNDETGLYHDGWVRNYVIANYQAMKATHEGEPQWNASLDGDTHGAEISANIWDWEGEDGVRGFDVHVNRDPNEPCDLNYVVTCTWGDETITATAVLHYLVPESLPGALDVPGEITIGVNHTYVLPLRTLDDYSFGQHVQVSFDCDYPCDRHWEWVNGRPAQYITPREPGIFGANVRLRLENMSIEKYVIIRVADENGNVPGIVPRLDANWYFDLNVPDQYLNYAIVPEGALDGRLTSNDVLEEVWVANDGELRRIYGDDYEWKLEYVSGADLGLYLSHEWHPNIPWVTALIFVGNQPTEPGESVYRLTMRFGPESAVVNIHVNAIDSRPTGMSVPEEITVKAGETKTFTAEFEPAGWRVPDREDKSGLDMNDENGLGEIDNDCYTIAYDEFDFQRTDNTFSVTGKTPGYYNIGVKLRSGNVDLYQRVRLTVTDENGSVPAPAPLFEDETYELTRPFGTLRYTIPDGLVSQDYVIGWGLDNAGSMLAFYQDFDPTWTVDALTEGISVSYEVWDDKTGCDIYLNSMPEPGDYRLRVTCEWQGESDSIEILVHYVVYDGELPTGNNLPKVIRMAADETRTFVGGYLPEGLDVEPTTTYFYGTDAIGCSFPDENTRATVDVTAYRTGAYEAYGMVGWIARGLVAEKEVLFIIKDTGDVLTLPAGTKAIKKGAFARTAVETVIVNSGCGSIGSRAFADCANLVEIVIPASVTFIAEDAFDGCGDFVINTPSAAIQQYAIDHGILWINE